MLLKLHNLNRFPDGENSDNWYDISSFSDYDEDKLREGGVEEAWYWYAEGSYEGRGQLLMLREGKYYLHDCSHCSCYGATSDIAFAKAYSSLDEIEKNCSKGAWNEIRMLVEKAKGDS